MLRIHQEDTDIDRKPRLRVEHFLTEERWHPILKTVTLHLQSLAAYYLKSGGPMRGTQRRGQASAAAHYVPQPQI